MSVKEKKKLAWLGDHEPWKATQISGIIQGKGEAKIFLKGWIGGKLEKGEREREVHRCNLSLAGSYHLPPPEWWGPASWQLATLTSLKVCG